LLLRWKGTTVGGVSIDGLPEVVRNRALACGATAWLDELPELVAELERDWSITLGRAYGGGTEAFVAQVTLADGSDAVLKLLIPRATNDVTKEVTALRLADGVGCVRLLRDDESRSALLLERLGPSMYDLDLPIAERHQKLCAAAQKIWRPAPDCGLPTGA
jgi:streptomycin 6-kinase